MFKLKTRKQTKIHKTHIMILEFQRMNLANSIQTQNILNRKKSNVHENFRFLKCVDFVLILCSNQRKLKIHKYISLFGLSGLNYDKIYTFKISKISLYTVLSDFEGSRCFWFICHPQDFPQNKRIIMCFQSIFDWFSWIWTGNLETFFFKLKFHSIQL